VGIGVGALAVDDAAGWITALRADHDRLAGVAKVTIAIAGEDTVAQRNRVAPGGHRNGGLDRGEIARSIRQDEVGRGLGGHEGG